MEALKSGLIKKPVVAWVSGTCAKLFKSEVQFGHAGARSGGALESAQVRSRLLWQQNAHWWAPPVASTVLGRLQPAAAVPCSPPRCGLIRHLHKRHFAGVRHVLRHLLASAVLDLGCCGPQYWQ